MSIDRVELAQRGVILSDALPAPTASARRAGAAKKGRGSRRPPRAAAGLSGPFLSPGTLTRAERLRLIEGIETVIDGVYTHLPLKRARYGIDPVQRLRILRSQVDELTDEAFHIELADVVTRLRDAHTRYAGPEVLAHQGRRFAVPRGDDRQREHADVRRDQGRARASTGVQARGRARVLERRPDRPSRPALQRLRGRWTTRQSACLGDAKPHAALAAVRPAS